MSNKSNESENNKKPQFKFSPIIKEFKNDEAVIHWFDARLSGKAASTKKNAQKAMGIYIHFLRNEYGDDTLMPQQLID
ncbi:hypothetical protein J2755_001774 [Methanohalophilus levihalophilus]|uniref:hypothetical protein n=1 Tax=Methanohalophilus levihalophilus TaxID=1431282 RepID=UPI001AE9942A|nr:hypothetical protein [Methanohalophilus levihalophilus]MBP2030826.1 hypothetical protein [Methanohalophilus levihalophilus]